MLELFIGAVYVASAFVCVFERDARELWHSFDEIIDADETRGIRKLG